MATVSTNDLKNGMGLSLPEGLFTVVEFQHVKPGKGPAFVRTKLKNVRSGRQLEKTYRADEKLEQAIIDKRDMQFLYRDGNDYVFMDNADYEQMNIPEGSLGESTKYLKENNAAIIQFYNDEIVGVDLPASVELEVTETEPGMQGDRVSGALKPATLETGVQINVPLFVSQGDRIKVDTRTGEYLTRVWVVVIQENNRRIERERVLSLLYEAEMKDCDVSQIIESLPVKPESFVSETASKVSASRSELDSSIERYAIKWNVERMASLDRNVLRIGAWELQNRPELSVALVISEAVELAKRFSTEESGKFVNGILSSMADDVRRSWLSSSP